MIVTYHEKHDLLYIRLDNEPMDDEPRRVTNVRVDEDIVLDVDDNDRVVGIEILDASKRVNLDQFLTVEYLKTA